MKKVGARAFCYATQLACQRRGTQGHERSWRFASIAQLAEHALSKRKVTSSTLVGGLPSDMV